MERKREGATEARWVRNIACSPFGSEIVPLCSIGRIDMGEVAFVAPVTLASFIHPRKRSDIS
jgi:hypothetical protein